MESERVCVRVCARSRARARAWGWGGGEVSIRPIHTDINIHLIQAD